MASLQSYLNWTALFDYTQAVPTLVLTDTGTYPAGVPALVKGNFTITQPDQLVRSNTDFVTAPDVLWNGTALNQFSIPLRLDCKGNVQTGLYTITYTVAATGYTNSFLTRTFEFVLAPVTGVITPAFDVFTPSLKAVDASIYTQAGFTDAESRTFTGLIQSNGVLISTSGTSLDLVYNGSYLDSMYTLTLNTVVTYTGNPLSWLSAKMNVAASLLQAANTPPSCSSMINQLTTYQNQQTAVGCGCATDTSAAEALLNSINTNLGNKTYSGLYNQILAFENIVTYGNYVYTNTGVAIPAYVYNCGSGGSGGGSGTVNSVTLSFTVGEPGYLLNGQSQAVFSALATGSGNAKTIVIFTNGGTPMQPGKDYTFTPATGTITLLNGQIFTTGAGIYIFAIF